MTKKQFSSKQAARHLLRELKMESQEHQPDKDLITDLVEAENSGLDVDADERFTALLEHMATCEACTVLYAELSESMIAAMQEDLPEQRVIQKPPTFFGPAHQTENLVLRVISGITRRFEALATIPQLAPRSSVLGPAQRISLFRDTIGELAGAPQVSISVGGEPGAVDLLIAINDLGGGGHWHVQAQVGDAVYTAATDERGVARLTGLPITSLQEVVISCFEAQDE